MTTDLGADIKGLEPMTAAEKSRFVAAPCQFCGYNGPGYFQPKIHGCAARYHATEADFIKALKSERDTAIAERDEARARLEEAKAVLAFYANKRNWHDSILLEHIRSTIEADCGDKARAFLQPTGGTDGRF